MVHECDYTIKETADILCKSEGWVKQWVQQFQDGGERIGINCLCDHPITSRQRKVPIYTVVKIIQKTLQESTFVLPIQIQQKLKQETGVEYHIIHIRPYAQ